MTLSTPPLPPLLRRRRAALAAVRAGLARELREAEGHSQAFVADCLGLDRSTICRYEQSLRTPTGARGRAYLDYVAELLGESR